jgi:hypothetical protein
MVERREQLLGRNSGVIERAVTAAGEQLMQRIVAVKVEPVSATHQRCDLEQLIADLDGARDQQQFVPTTAGGRACAPRDPAQPVGDPRLLPARCALVRLSRVGRCNS